MLSVLVTFSVAVFKGARFAHHCGEGTPARTEAITGSITQEAEGDQKWSPA